MSFRTVIFAVLAVTSLVLGATKPMPQSNVMASSGCEHRAKVMEMVHLAIVSGNEEAIGSVPFAPKASCSVSKASKAGLLETGVGGIKRCRRLINSTSLHSPGDIQGTELWLVDVVRMVARVNEGSPAKRKYSLATTVAINRKCKITRADVFAWDTSVAPHPRPFSEAAVIAQRNWPSDEIAKARFKELKHDIRKAAKEGRHLSGVL